jgi:hypothetical protein
MTYQKYAGKQGTGEFRAMTVSEATMLTSGAHVWFLTIQGDARTAKVNGKPKTWKTLPGRVEVPIKYGLYEYCRFDERDIANGRLLVEMI